MNHRKTFAAAAWVLASAFLHVISFPPAGLSLLSFISLVPLLRIIHKSDGYLRSFLPGMLWGTAIAVGLSVPIHYAVTVHYGKPFYISIILILFAVAIPAGLLYGTAGTAIRYFDRGGSITRAFIAASIFTLAEYVKEAFPLFIPWGGIGMSLVPLNRYIQMADVIGPYGLIFITVLVNFLIADIINPIRPSGPNRGVATSLFEAIKIRKSAVILLISLLVIPVIYGIARIDMIDAEDEKRTTARIVQGNFGQKTRWMESSFTKRLTTHLELSGKSQVNRPRLVVWPETVLNSAGRNTDEFFSFIISGIGRESTLIAGGIRRDPRGVGFFNSAFVIDESGLLRWYDKRILLPYAEFSPFGGILGGFYSAPAEFLRGTTPLAVDTGLGRAGLSICFEVLYSWHVRRAVLEGAQFLVNISNDGWFGPTSEPEMHLHAAILRAIEMRRYLVRSTNSGISAIISPSGKILASAGLFRKAAIEAPISVRGDMTPYARFGDWILYLSALLLLIQTALQVFRKR